MKNLPTYFFAAVVLLILASYALTYQVRYDEVAIVTTFDKATQESVKMSPGLGVRWPWPVEKVTKYSTRINLLEDTLEEQQTADGKTVIVQTYLAWRIDDPLKFFRALNRVDEAERQLSSRLREIRGIISQYDFDQLVNRDPSRIKLGEIERRAAEALQLSLDGVIEAEDAIDLAADEALPSARTDGSGVAFGIKIERVGIRRLVLPENVTTKVFETMKKTRERMAEHARQEGQAQASAMRSEAESARDRILAFAERRAQAIRAEGDREAIVAYQAFAKNEDFAIFLRQMEAMRKMLPQHTTFVLDSNSLGILDLFNREPSIGTGPSTASLPEPTLPDAPRAER